MQHLVDAAITRPQVSAVAIPRDILIIEDHPLVAAATQALLERGARGHSIFHVSSAGQARALLTPDPGRWHLILLDLDVPGAIGLSLANEIKNLGLARITCVLTGADRPDYIAQVRQDGFLGYIPKAARSDYLEDALSSILAMGRSFPPIASQSTDKARCPSLTRRQGEILQRASEGKTSKEIARLVGLSPGTIDNHIAAAMEALDARTRSGAVQRALALGLIKAAKEMP